MKNSIGAPHDLPDLYLAPVALAVDSWLAERGELSDSDLNVQLVLSTNHEPSSVADRQVVFIEALSHDVELHGWQAELDTRGVRIVHADRGVVLGLPENVRSYLAG